MKYLIAMLMSATFAQTTFANDKTSVLHCSFTEPFYFLTIDLQTNTISRTSPEETSPVVIENGIRVTADLSDLLVPRYAIRTQTGKVFAQLILNGAGSDGMSDIVWPYDIQVGNQRGGCDSNILKRSDPHP